ncbi:MAG: hypothetical protein K2L11_04085 [Muribaculaceae bacterium]|nr:hypothetical protein [Muribaculaceae bacterium]
MTTKDAPLTILTLKAGILHAEFTDCIKPPGIYGTIMDPIELLDTLTIKDGTNATCVRFAAQFRLTQTELNKKIKEGVKIVLSERLNITSTDIPQE